MVYIYHPTSHGDLEDPGIDWIPAPGGLEDLSPVQINGGTNTGDPDAKVCKHSSDVMSDVMIHTCRIGKRDDMGLSPSVPGLSSN